MKKALPVDPATRQQQDEALDQAMMQIMLRPEISALDQLKIEANVLVAVLRALRAELGEQRANELVMAALREGRRAWFHRTGALMPGTPKEKWQAMNVSFQPKLGEDWDCEIVDGDTVEAVDNSRFFEMLKEDREALDFNVTGCRYADFFRAIGEPELGGVLMCEGDVHVTEVGSPEVEFTRTQTIMKGADCCDFRFRIKTEQP